jgi:hypothetical protein
MKLINIMPLPALQNIAYIAKLNADSLHVIRCVLQDFIGCGLYIKQSGEKVIIEKSRARLGGFDIKETDLNNYIIIRNNYTYDFLNQKEFEEMLKPYLLALNQL